MRHRNEVQYSNGHTGNRSFMVKAAERISRRYYQQERSLCFWLKTRLLTRWMRFGQLRLPMVFQSWCSYSIFKGPLLRIWDCFSLRIPPISPMLSQSCGGISEHQRHTISCFTACQPGITVSASLRSFPAFRRTSVISI